MLVPQGCVMANNTGGHFVFLLTEEENASGGFRVIRRDITLDRAIGNRWLVKGGLEQGERLVVEGLQKVMPGALVKGVPSADGTGRK